MKYKPINSFTLDDVLNTVSENYASSIKEAIKTIIPMEYSNKICFQRLFGGISQVKVFRFDVNNKKYVLRLLDENEPIERRRSELNAHQIGAKLKISPTLFYVDQSLLVMVMEFIEGRTFSRKDLDNCEITTKIMQAIKKFHSYVSDEYLRKQSKVESIQSLYEHNKTKNGVVYPSCFDQLHKKLQSDCANLKTIHLPSHGDLNRANILIGENGNIYLIDWAEAGIDNPFLDIGWFSCCSAANNDQVKNLLTAYLGRNPDESEIRETLFFRDVSIFYIATFWMGWQKERNQEKLNALLAAPSLNGSKYFIEDIPLEIAAQKRGLDLTMHALTWLKKFISNQSLHNSVKGLPIYTPEQGDWCTSIRNETIHIKNQINKYNTKNSSQPFLLILGVSGAGKSTIIQHLKKLDPRIVLIVCSTTRPLRPGENEKISITIQEMEQLEQQGEVFAVINHCGVTYGIPFASIETALSNDQIPVLDFPINKLDLMQSVFGEKLFCVYVAPPDLATLKKRLASDGRDKNGDRFLHAQKELEAFSKGAFAPYINKLIINQDGKAEHYAREILEEIGTGQTDNEDLLALNSQIINQMP